MFSDLAVRVHELGKSYQLYERPQDRLKQFIWGARRQFYQELRALDGVCFDVRRWPSTCLIRAVDSSASVSS